MRKAVTTLMALALTLVFGVQAQAQGESCLAQRGSPGCTANDVSGFVVDEVVVVESCNEGTMGEAVVDLTVTYGQGNANVRYDVGVFAGDDAVNGIDDCSVGVAGPGSPGATDEDEDGCYDKASETGLTITLEGVVVTCPEELGEDVDVSIAVVWDNNSNTVCNSDDDAVNGTPSKCEIGTAVIGTTPLPVELVSFVGEANGKDATLRWSTASESNNAGFSIEHSYRGSTYKEVGFVEGRGTTTLTSDYSYRVGNLAPGRHNFRLKQVDFDGSFSFSPEIEVVMAVPDRFVLEAAYPNPFNPATTINFLVAEQAPVRVELYNALGKLVRTLYQGTPEANTTQSVRIDGTNLTSGAYVVRLVGNNFVGTQQIVLLK